MADFDPTRRKFGMGVGTALGISLAGCLGGDDDEGDDTADADDGTDDTNGTDDTDGTDDTSEDGGGDTMLSVTVLSSTGGNPPIEGATVLIDGEDVGETDEMGVLETSAEPGEYEVEAQRLRHQPKSDTVEVDEDGGEIEFILEEVETDGEATLALDFQNEDGGNVEIGMDVILAHEDGIDVIERSYVGSEDEIDHFSESYNWHPGRMRAPLDDDGEVINILNPLTPEFAGEWTLTVEANEENDFETYEETFEFTEGDLEDEIEVVEHITLEGAMSEGERWHEQAIVLDGEQHHIETNYQGAEELYGEDQLAVGYDPDEDLVRNEAWDGSDSQHWTFELVGDEDEKWHRIVHEETGDVISLDLQDDGGWGWDLLTLDSWDDSDEQLWRIRPASEYDPGVEDDNLYIIECKHYTKDDRFEVGSAIQLGLDSDLNEAASTWWYNYGELQQFALSPHE